MRNRSVELLCNSYARTGLFGPPRSETQAVDVSISAYASIVYSLDGVLLYQSGRLAPVLFRVSQSGSV